MVIVRASVKSVAQYKKLMASDWTKALPQDVLHLLWNALEFAGDSTQEKDLHALLDPAQAAPFPTDFLRSIMTRISEGTKFVPWTGLPELPSEYVPAIKQSALAWQANSLATWLTLPAHTKVSGDLAFLADVQSLTFQAAVHFLLPILKKRQPLEHALVLHAAALFALGYYPNDPSHSSYLVSMIHDYLGNEEKRLRSLYASFRFTAPQDHSYLTKAQEYWMELLDKKKYEEVEEFLFSLNRWSLPSQQEEVGEMIVEAIGFIQKANRQNQKKTRT